VSFDTLQSKEDILLQYINVICERNDFDRRSNNFCTDLLYIHTYQYRQIFFSSIILLTLDPCNAFLISLYLDKHSRAERMDTALPINFHLSRLSWMVLNSFNAVSS
jgi:hypothetical protein